MAGLLFYARIIDLNQDITFMIEILKAVCRMLKSWIDKLNIWNTKGLLKESLGGKMPEFTRLSTSLQDNKAVFESMFDGCADFIEKDFVISGMAASAIMIDNMIDKVALSESIMNPLMSAKQPQAMMSDEDKYVWIRDLVLAAIDEKEVFSVEDCLNILTAGYVIIFFEGIDKSIALGVQGYKFRSIEEPNLEKVLRGSREGFVEPVHINMSLVRRKIRNPNLKFEMFNLGKESKTDICICYIKNIASETVINEVRRRLNSIDIDTVLASGNIQVFFQDHPNSIFQTVGYTERPDTFCGKLNEGRVGMLVDGTPIAIFMPYLFVENFQNMDDYAVGTYYATFTRILKYLSFFISVLVPGLYVAIGSFHQSLLPSNILFTLAQSEEATPFPLILEALMMQVIYEIIREAGLRLPKQFGFAITIVGALIVGQAAVSAGLIGAPMVIIVAVTATTSLVVPTLYEPGVVLRFVFIILAGISGIYGLVIGIAFVALHMCSLKSYDIPYMSPLMPYDLYSMRDVVIRAPWKVLASKKNKVQDLVGSNVDKDQNL